jgi:DNA-3-methyladenine glycosylase I
MTTAGYLTAFGGAGAGFADGVPYPAMRRCEWAGSDPLMVAYHDQEWGVPVRDDRTLFEFLTLEGAQAGLSWMTILRRRDAYRRAFAGFDPAAVAAYGEGDLERLLGDAAIVRNRAKVASTIANARALLGVQADSGSFAEHLWSFVDGSPLQPQRRSMADIPAETPLARAISGDLRRRGFAFVGPKIVYALMQACGLVNDHVTGCYRWSELAASG